MVTSPKYWTSERFLKGPCRLYANWKINRSLERWTYNQRCVCSFTRLNALLYYVVKLTRNLTISGRRIQLERGVGMHVKCEISNSEEINLFSIIAARADRKGVTDSKINRGTSSTLYFEFLIKWRINTMEILQLPS